MEMIRRFHPVWQWAFYTERFFDKGKNIFNMVYDFWSSTKWWKEIIEEIIKREFQDTQIDILFLSHLHEDHVNWLEYFKKYNIDVKNIVLPLMNEVEIYLLKETLDWYMDTSELRKMFKDSMFYFVREIESNLENEELDWKIINFWEEIKIEWIESFWKYIPFNFKDKTIINKIKEKFPTEKLDIDFINKNKSDLRKIYEKENNDININSLVLFSWRDFWWTKLNISNNSNHYCKYWIPCFYEKFFNAQNCLYFWDFNLNYHDDYCEQIVNKIKDNIIWTIQIPHHWSYKSFNSNILRIPQYECTDYVISHWIYNKFWHPHNEVIKKIYAFSHNEYCSIYFVNEKESSELIQKIEI